MAKPPRWQYTGPDRRPYRERHPGFSGCLWAVAAIVILLAALVILGALSH